MIPRCNKCLHYKKGGFCDRSVSIDISYITGRKESKGRKLASKERDTNALLAPFVGKCGPNGRYYVLG